MILTYNNKIVMSGNKICSYEQAISPFDIVSDADFDRNLQLHYKNVPNYSSKNNYNKSTDPQSMLYRKVKVNSTINVTKFEINTNVSPATDTTLGEFVQFNKTHSPFNMMPSCYYIWDENLTTMTHLNPPSTAYDIIGEVDRYIETSTHNWSWYFLRVYCNVTLQPGIYWWPVIVQHHRTFGSTQFGKHSTLDCDLLILPRYNNPGFTTNPPIYSTITNGRPYLHLFDSDGNEYSV